MRRCLLSISPSVWLLVIACVWAPSDLFAPDADAPDAGETLVDRDALYQDAGFQPITDAQVAAVNRALDFLQKNQKSDGHFDDGGQYPVAMTALAGLAFLSAGHTPYQGRYSPVVKKAMEWILKQQNPKGLFVHGEIYRSMYGHGFGTLFLSQCYGMGMPVDDAERVREALTKAVVVISESQSHNGGWYYSPYSNSDEGSVTVTQAQALRGCANNGIPVPDATIRKAVEYMEKSQAADGTIRYSISSGGGGSTALTAAGVEVFYSLGQYASRSSTVAKSLDALRLAYRRGQRSGHEAYTTFYAAQAFHQSSDADFIEFFPGMRTGLLRAQKASGAFPGDWVGDTYGTALSVMTLCVPYELLPIFQR